MSGLATTLWRASAAMDASTAAHVGTGVSADVSRSPDRSFITATSCSCSPIHQGAVAGRRGEERRRKEVNSQGMAGIHFIATWQDSRVASFLRRRTSRSSSLHRGRRASRRHSTHHQSAPTVVDEIGGEYQDNFDDVNKHLIDYFTYKAVKTVLAQLYEMNPQQYAWFYNFVVSNKPQDSQVFLRVLVRDKQELGERVMVTRLHLFRRWAKRYSHADINDAIGDQNLEVLRERLMQTVKLTPDAEDPRDRPPPQI